MSRARTASVLVVLAAAVAFALGLARVWGFFTDDSYIHLVFARNLARGLGFCFNPGEPVYGFTSPLWILLLAVGERGPLGGALLSKLLGLLFTLLAVIWTGRLARAAGGSAQAALLAGGALAFHAWFLRWSLSGMETSLAAFLIALGLERLLRGGAAAGAGLMVLALAALARPEAGLAFLIGVLACLSPGLPSAAGRRWVWGALLGCAILAGWELWIHRATGSFLPTAFTVKRAHEALSLGAIARPTVHFAEVVGATDAVLALAAGAALLRLSKRAGGVPAPLLVLAAWPAALALLYLLTRFQMISRYWIPASPALAACAFVALERSFEGARTRAAITGVYFAQQLGVLLLLVFPQIDAFTRGLDQGPAFIGRWLHGHAPAGARVATPDIGAIAYFSERPVLDLGGLVTPAMAQVLAAHDLEQVVREGLFTPAGTPDYLVDRALPPGALGPPRYQLILATQAENLGISRPGPHTYALYRVLPGGEGAAR